MATHREREVAPSLRFRIVLSFYPTGTHSSSAGSALGTMISFWLIMISPVYWCWNTGTSSSTSSRRAVGGSNLSIASRRNRRSDKPSIFALLFSQRETVTRSKVSEKIQYLKAKKRVGTLL